MIQSELRQLLVLANDFKEGDLLVGGTREEAVRQEARRALATLRVGEIAQLDLIEDSVTETLARGLDKSLTPEIAALTVQQVKELLLSPEGVNWARRYRTGLTSETIAAVVKLMSNEELSTVARRLFNPLPGAGVTIGAPQHFGSRIQPNSPGDDETEILFSILEGLTYGCGDVILGLNPASDEGETIVRLEELLRRVVERLELPTRYCVLSDIIKQTTARARTQVDVGFQSLAGTTKALTGMVGLDVAGLLDLARGFAGLYFETGQGSEVTNGAAEGVDMVTLEARTYGVARYLQQQTGAWLIVNDVAGFIGPEVFRSAEQLLRACLEDSVMAKLHGLTMGLDVCSTFHMGIEPAILERLTETIVEQAAPAYLMAVAGQADPMLGYLTTSFREHPRLRQRAGRQVTTAMQQRLAALGLRNAAGQVNSMPQQIAALYAQYQKAGGESRSLAALEAEGLKQLADLRQRGFDLGYGADVAQTDPPASRTRVEAIYRHARQSLYARLDRSLLYEVAPLHLAVRTEAHDRDDYLAHPPAGEMICQAGAERLRQLYPTRRPQVQLVISDGLNADAVNENLRLVLPGLKHKLADAGFHLGEVEIVIENGRVRAGYHVGAVLDVAAVIHLLGERPGTGLNMLSAYLTYGRDPAGGSRWAPALDHSATTAICGINRRGKAPETATDEIVRCIGRMFEQRCSGVALGSLGNN